MNITAIVGSPRKKGNCSVIVENFVKNLEVKGHKSEVYNLYDSQIKGCIACDACTNGKVDVCVHNDEFIKMAESIKKSDVLIFASPIYMGQISGPAKTFLDRFYTFADEDFSIRHIKGKKFITVTTSGAPAEQFAEVTEYLQYWLGEFFKMEHSGSIIAGELIEPGSIDLAGEIGEQIEALVNDL